jgi:hypothetical protein
MRNPLERTRRLLFVLAAGLGLSILSWISYAAVTWYRYGRADDAAGQDSLLDRFMPAYEVRERHEIRVRAPAKTTLTVARELDLQRSRLVRAIFHIRTLPSLLRGERKQERPRSFLAETLSIGWSMLAEVPERQIVMGAVTQPWEPVVRFRPLPANEFAAFNEPGYAQIAWTLEAEPIGADESLFRTETRVRTTDSESRERFRRYWSIFSPGILLIRYEALRLVKGQAERQGLGG